MKIYCIIVTQLLNIMIGVNIIGVYKSGIKIKKSRRGLFTDYCGGKVTNECIQKAKKSKNPKLRKRATFAENARGWAKKHTNGGEININLPELIVTPKQKQIELHNKYIQNIPEEIRNYVNKFSYKTIGTEYRDPVERFMEVYDKAGNPKIIMNAPIRLTDSNGNPRAYYDGNVNIPKGSNNVYKSAIEEFAHPIEYDIFGFSPKRITQFVKNQYNELKKVHKHYNDKDNYEFRTHKIVEPKLYGYVLGADKNWDDVTDKILGKK